MKKNPSALKTEHFAGLILAGGEGKRWGGPKAFAKLDDGRTFLEAGTAALIGAGASPVVATLPPGTGDPGIDGLDAFALPESGMDMFGSLKFGLEKLVKQRNWQVAAVLPVDHPLVRPDTVAHLAASNARAAIPSYRGKHGHPVCLGREVASGIVEGEFPGPTLRDVLRSVGAGSVEIDDPGVVANCNTPDALSEALKRIRE